MSFITRNSSTRAPWPPSNRRIEERQTRKGKRQGLEMPSCVRHAEHQPLTVLPLHSAVPAAKHYISTPCASDHPGWTREREKRGGEARVHEGEIDLMRHTHKAKISSSLHVGCPHHPLQPQLAHTRALSGASSREGTLRARSACFSPGEGPSTAD